MDKKSFKGPKKRSRLRERAGVAFYSAKRRILWLKMRSSFARGKQSEPLEFLSASHKTPLLRKLKDVDMRYQHNKVVNLKIAAPKINGIILKPGQVFSYWYLIGNATKRKGYTAGMVLKNGRFGQGIGGGLCQLSNLIFWMTLHTPLTVIERHRHGYDVFPDSGRTQPFGSGATCFYPYIDLMIKNETPHDYQLLITVGEENLEGEWRCSAPREHTYSIIEKNHRIICEFWGGYTRRNELYRQTADRSGEVTSEELVVKNTAIMMYNPLLEERG